MARGQRKRRGKIKKDRTGDYVRSTTDKRIGWQAAGFKSLEQSLSLMEDVMMYVDDPRPKLYSWTKTNGTYRDIINLLEGK